MTSAQAQRDDDIPKYRYRSLTTVLGQQTNASESNVKHEYILTTSDHSQRSTKFKAAMNPQIHVTIDKSHSDGPDTLKQQSPQHHVDPHRYWKHQPSYSLHFPSHDIRFRIKRRPRPTSCPECIIEVQQPIKDMKQQHLFLPGHTKGITQRNRTRSTVNVGSMDSETNGHVVNELEAMKALNDHISRVKVEGINSSKAKVNGKVPQLDDVPDSEATKVSERTNYPYYVNLCKVEAPAQDLEASCLLAAAVNQMEYNDDSPTTSLFEVPSTKHNTSKSIMANLNTWHFLSLCLCQPHSVFTERKPKHQPTVVSNMYMHVPEQCS